MPGWNVPGKGLVPAAEDRSPCEVLTCSVSPCEAALEEKREKKIAKDEWKRFFNRNNNKVLECQAGMWLAGCWVLPAGPGHSELSDVSLISPGTGNPKLSLSLGEKPVSQWHLQEDSLSFLQSHPSGTARAADKHYVNACSTARSGFSCLIRSLAESASTASPVCILPSEAVWHIKPVLSGFFFRVF